MRNRLWVILVAGVLALAVSACAEVRESGGGGSQQGEGKDKSISHKKRMVKLR